MGEKNEILDKAAAQADASTKVTMGHVKALLAIYSEEEQAAGMEIGLMMVFQAGRIAGLAEAAAMAQGK